MVAEAADGAEALELAREHRPDLAILDIAMPRLTGLQAARELSRTLPETRILVLTMYDNEQFFFEALAAGASGYVLKSVADQDLVQACHATMRGEPFLYPGRSTPSSTTTSTSRGRAGPCPRRRSPTARSRSSSSSPRATPRSRSRTCW